MAGSNANTMCKISLDRKNIKIVTSRTCDKNEQALWRKIYMYIYIDETKLWFKKKI